MTNNTNLLTISALSVVLIMFAGASQADAAIFVQIPNMGDDSITTEGYNDGTWFVADSFKCGIDNTTKKKSGEKGGTEDINIGVGELQDCTISKGMDFASAQLAQFAINGNSPGTAEIDFVEVGGGDTDDMSITYLKYKLDRVFIKIWGISGNADEKPTEEVVFYYNKIAFAYTPEGEDVPKPNNIMSWDNVKNIPWEMAFDPIRELLFPTEKSK